MLRNLLLQIVAALVLLAALSFVGIVLPFDAGDPVTQLSKQ